MNTIKIKYTANNGSEKVLENVEEKASDKFSQFFSNKPSKYFQINREGQYPLLQVCCRGACNTYWRTIGRYPEVVAAVNVTPKPTTVDYSEATYLQAVEDLAAQCVAMAKEDYTDADEIKFAAAEYCGDSLQDLNAAIKRQL